MPETPGTRETPAKPAGRPARGLIGSILVHALVAAFVFLQWPFPSLQPPEEETVAVEIVPEPEEEPLPEEEEQEEEPVPEEEPEPEEEQAPEEDEAPPEPPEPAPSATMLAVRPPASDAPEREDALGLTQPEEAPSPVETAPDVVEDAETGEPQAGPDAQVPEDTTEASPEPEELQPDESEPAEPGEDAAAEGEGEADAEVVIETPPIPEGRPDMPTAGSGAAGESAPPLREAARTLSDARLSDPTMRAALGQLPLPRRIVQLCTVEALEQIMEARPGTPLHGMVPFAAHSGSIVANTLDADGGAYRTMAGEWYDIAFRCTVDPDRMAILAFSYRLGDRQVSRQERIARGLPAD